MNAARRLVEGAGIALVTLWHLTPRRPGELDRWAWCDCEAARRVHAHAPGGALVFPTGRTPAERARFWARWAIAAAAAAVLVAIVTNVLVFVVAR